VIRFKKMDRKSLAVSIGPSGVEVRLPQWASVRDPRVREAISQHLTRAARLVPPEPDPPRPLTREELRQETEECARRLQVEPKRLQVRTMSTRWGSCTSRGNVTLSDRILQMTRLLREYLICHELAHLRVLNHGPEFRQLMAQVMPDWKLREEWLVGWIARRELQAMTSRRR
jgi:predicted metal-dependent hydrolase